MNAAAPYDRSVRALWSGALGLFLVATLGLSSAAGAQTGSESEQPCGRLAEVTVVFTGEVEEILDATVIYRIRSVTTGEADVDVLEVDYPGADNVRFLDVGATYRVASNLVGGRYRSLIPTARDACVGPVRTLHRDGSAIDTGTFAEVNERLPRIARTLGIVLAAVLIVLIVIGWLFDRPRAYR